MITLINRNGYYIRVSQNKPNGFEENMNYLLRKVIEYSGLTEAEIKGPSRKFEIVVWRHIMMYIAVRQRYGSLSEVATFLGRVNHTTCISAVRSMESRIDTNDLYVMSRIKQLGQFITVKPNTHVQYKYVPGGY